MPVCGKGVRFAQRAMERKAQPLSQRTPGLPRREMACARLLVMAMTIDSLDFRCFCFYQTHLIPGYLTSAAGLAYLGKHFSWDGFGKSSREDFLFQISENQDVTGCH